MISEAGVAVVAPGTIVPAHRTVVPRRPITRRTPGTILGRTTAVRALPTVAVVGRVPRMVGVRAVPARTGGAAGRSGPAIAGAGRVLDLAPRAILPVLACWALGACRSL